MSTSRFALTPDNVLDRTSWGADIYCHILRKYYPDETVMHTCGHDLEADFAILKNTLCGSALSENLFHDNPQDLRFLLSDPGRRAIISLHVEGIINYINNFA